MTFKIQTNVIKHALVLVLIVAMLVSSLPASLIQSDSSVAQAAGKDTPFSWDNATVYFVMTDRFYDGDPSNNHSYGRELDANGKPYAGYKNKIGSFHGGDLKGLTAKLNEGYFTDLGVNAIWITSPLEQIHGYVGGYSFRHYGYHGYFPLDFTEVDQNMGTADDLRTFIDLAHSKGIRILFDVVINHVGYGDLITMSKYGFGDPKSAMFDGKMTSWQEYYYKDSYNSTNKSEWSAHFDNYTKFISNTDTSAWAKWWGPDWMRAHNTPGYAPCGTGELDMCLANLPDFKTESTKEVGLPPIMLTKWDAAKESKEIAELEAFFKRTGKPRTVSNYMIKWITDWVREYGVDGFRLDTAKHVENHVWADLKDEATIALREWKKNNPTKKIDDADFWMTGEVFGHKVEKTSYFTEGKYDSIINFDFLWDDVPAKIPNKLNELDMKFADYAAKMNTDPTFQVLNQLSSHDTTLYGTDYKDARNNNINAATSLMLAPGAAQIYYGDESGRPYGPYPNGPADVGSRCNRAPDAACDLEAGTRSAMNWSSLNQTYLAHWRKMGQFRAEHIAVGAGQHKKLQDAPYAFSRTYSQDGIEDKIVAAIEAKGPSTIDVSTVWPNGTIVRDFYTGNTATVLNGKVTFTPGQHGVILIENVNAPPPKSTAYASPGGAEFSSATQQIKLILRNSTSGKYTIDGRDPKTNGINFVSGDVITIGSTMKEGDAVNLRLYTNGTTGESTNTYIFRKVKKNELTLHFKKPANWGTPQLFYYDAKPSAPSVTWNGAPQMTEGANGYFSYTIKGANTATVLFKDSLGNQLPGSGQPGFVRSSESYYDGTAWQNGNPNGSGGGGGGGEPPPVDPEPPVTTEMEPPQNLRLIKQELTALTLAWDASASAGVTGYNIYRNGVKVGNSLTTTYRDSGLLVDTDYEYTIRSLDAKGQVSDVSAITTATTLADGDSSVIEDEFIPVDDEAPDSTVIEITAQQFEDALSNINGGILSFTLPSEDDEVKVKIAGEMLQVAASAAKQLRISTPKYTYTVPLKAYDMEALSAELGDPIDKISMILSIFKADEQTKIDFESAIEKMKVVALSDLIMYKVDVVADDGSIIRMDQYENSFAARTIHTDVNLTTSRLTVLQYDADLKRLSFAPATFALVDNKRVATAMLNHHPYLVVVESVRTFNDLSNTKGRADIEALASKRLINGINDRQYGPNNFVTRAEFATMIVNALGLKPDASINLFSDVKSNQWFAGHVGAAVKYKIVNGMTDGTFRPSDRITRQQMAVMIGNAMRLAGVEIQATSTQLNSTMGSYADRNTVGSWARNDVARALRAGIIRGTRTGTGLNVVPNEQVRREEVAVSIRKMMTTGKLMN